MRWTTLADSHIGGRDEQQDRYLLASSDDGDCHLLAVADGAGGHIGGAAAAQTAIDCISENLSALWLSDDPDTFIRKLILECNERVVASAGGDLSCTTLVMVLIKGEELYWGHVGDSRLYLIRDSKVVAKTIDHSVAELQGQRAFNQANAAEGVAANGLYMCLGAPTNIVPEVSSSVAREGDTLLLCSDGLWGQLDMQALITELNDDSFTLETLNKWIEIARVAKRDHSDNITFVGARLVGTQGVLSALFKTLSQLFKKS